MEQKHQGVDSRFSSLKQDLVDRKSKRPKLIEEDEHHITPYLQIDLESIEEGKVIDEELNLFWNHDVRVVDYFEFERDKKVGKIWLKEQLDWVGDFDDDIFEDWKFTKYHDYKYAWDDYGKRVEMYVVGGDWVVKAMRYDEKMDAYYMLSDISAPFCEPKDDDKTDEEIKREGLKEAKRLIQRVEEEYY